MTIGEKIKEARRKAGYSQEQFAEKLAVSRQAITKWENDRGIPDIPNLKAIAELLNVSVDYLLDDGTKIDCSVIKENINLSDYTKTGTCRSKEDAVVLEKYPDAEIIPLFRKKKLNKVTWILDFLTTPGIFNVADSFKDMSSYYLVEKNGKQYFVNVTKEFIISSELVAPVREKSFMIGDNKFTKALYRISDEK